VLGEVAFLITVMCTKSILSTLLSMPLASVPSLDPAFGLIMEEARPHIVGGYADAGADEAQTVANAVRSDIERSLGHPAALFTVLQSRTQVVAGTNYRLKVQVAETECVHVRVYQPLPYTHQGPALKDFKGGKSLEDPLD